MLSFAVKGFAVWLFLVSVNSSAIAQPWMDGYEFRKKITFDKTKILGARAPNGLTYNDPTNFTVLIELADEAFKYHPSSCNGISDVKGRNISFALTTDPTVKLSFQIESYEPFSGKYRCWVKIPSLSASQTQTSATSVYFYYGGNTMHDNYTVNNLTTWSGHFKNVWHMSGEDPDFGIPNVKNNLATETIRGPGINAGSFVEAKNGKGVLLDGHSTYLQGHTDKDITSMTISAWVKTNQSGAYQTIMTNDSTVEGKRGGWKLGINADGHIEFTTYRNAGYTCSTIKPLSPDKWHFINCAYTVGGNSSSTLILIDGIAAGSAGRGYLSLYPGGRILIGKSRQNDQFFNGYIDEITIENVAHEAQWLRNRFTNQNDPNSFYVVGKQEYNASWSVFMGETNAAYEHAANWHTGIMPPYTSAKNVAIAAGRTARLTGPELVHFNQLNIEPGATLSTATDLYIKCNAAIGENASIQLDNGTQIHFEADLLNNGTISLNHHSGKVIFHGSRPVQTVSGTGKVTVSAMDINKSQTKDSIVLQSPINLTTKLKLIRGILFTNGKLTLLSASQINTAALLPVENENDITIAGDVNVHHYINGNFPNPATARGWRLIASPVYQLPDKKYGFKAIQKHVFVTGVNESTNGFDPSPMHGATIYTHDQNRMGTLAQKYVAIPDMDATVPLGKGFYLYSRGNRNDHHAYENQILNPPFVNPAGYMITHTGKLHIGNLSVDCSNKDTNGEGDGFNLIGNPYAAPVRWGSLSKVNLQEAVWLFDPLNNAYYTSDDPETIIGSGSGFFVRVKKGFSSGSLGFTESAKYVSPSFHFQASRPLNSKSLLLAKEKYSDLSNQNNTLNITLKRKEFSQPLVLKLTDQGRPGLSDGDAVKIGEGFVSIGSLSADGIRLSIDERGLTDNEHEISVFTKGYETGTYQLRFTNIESFPDQVKISLKDNFLKTIKVLTSLDSLVEFNIDLTNPETFGDARFVIILNQKETIDKKPEEPPLLAWPNPFTNELRLKTDVPVKNANVNVIDVMGRSVLNKELGNLNSGDVVTLPLGHLLKGIYFIRVTDSGKPIGKVLKVLKE